MDDPLIARAKADERSRLKRAVERLSEADKGAGSEAMGRILAGRPEWTGAGVILGFWPRPDEPDDRPWLEAALKLGKTVGLPAWNAQTGAYEVRQVTSLESELIPGKYGIAEPQKESPVLSLNRLDFCLVPGIGFSPLGCRLGRGKGFYDRLLSRFAGLNCGVAFDCQLDVEVRMEPHDVRMNWILTPTRWLPCPRSSAPR